MKPDSICQLFSATGGHDPNFNGTEKGINAEKFVERLDLK